LNRYHFLAAIGLANCHLQMDDVSAALEAFRLSLRINPDLESVRGQILHLEKIVED
jgi:tetratricopeptide (TPR) repeat protein